MATQLFAPQPKSTLLLVVHWRPTGILVLILAFGCVYGQVADLELEVARVSQELAEAQRALVECETGADRLLEAAEASFEMEDWQAVLAASEQLATSHPGSEQALAVAELSDRSTAHIEAAHEEETRRIEAEKKEQEAVVRRAVSRLKTEFDDMRGITWFKHRASPKGVNSRSSVYFYFGETDTGIQPMRLVLQYVGDDWLFLQEFIVKVDDETFKVDSGDERDHGGGRVWEWDDRSISRWDPGLVSALKQAETVKVRFQGRQYYKDHSLSRADTDALRETAAAYDALLLAGGSGTNDQ